MRRLPPKDKDELNDHSAHSNEQFFRRQREQAEQDAAAFEFEEELPYDIRPDAGPKLVFSNFLLTISTNVVPVDELEHGAVSLWLMDECNNLFDDWAMLNGTVLKPAGAPNGVITMLPQPDLVAGVRSRITLEKGEQRGQVHAHVVLEVAHRYTSENRNGFQFRGVHVNSGAIRNYLGNRIHLMQIDEDRRPNSIYVHCRLITKKTDQQAKWLTLQYIGKDFDSKGVNIARQRIYGTAEEQNIERGLRNPDLAFAPLNWRDANVGLGGALNDTQGGDSPPMMRAAAQDNGSWAAADSEGANILADIRAPVSSVSSISDPSDVSSSWDPKRGDLPTNIVWASKTARRNYKRRNP